MNQIRLLLLCILVATMGSAQNQPSGGAGQTPSAPAALNAQPAAADAQPATTSAQAAATAAIVNPEAQSASIRILTPVSGQMLTSNFVELRFELVQPSLSGEPIFLVQLDGADPVNTTSTNSTFSGLQPGLHSVRVTLVDANNSPVQGGTATVQFKVPSAAQPAHSDSSHGERQRSIRTIAGNPPAAPIPPELRKDGDLNLPMAGSPLPLISLVGFGLLIGGAAQTMRSR